MFYRVESLCYKILVILIIYIYLVHGFAKFIFWRPLLSRRALQFLLFSRGSFLGSSSTSFLFTNSFDPIDNHIHSTQNNPKQKSKPNKKWNDHNEKHLKLTTFIFDYVKETTRQQIIQYIFADMDDLDISPILHHIRFIDGWVWIEPFSSPGDIVDFAQRVYAESVEVGLRVEYEWGGAE